jgi:hypothetical protein
MFLKISGVRSESVPSQCVGLSITKLPDQLTQTVRLRAILTHPRVWQRIDIATNIEVFLVASFTSNRDPMPMADKRFKLRASGHRVGSVNALCGRFKNGCVVTIHSLRADHVRREAGDCSAQKFVVSVHVARSEDMYAVIIFSPSRLMQLPLRMRVRSIDRRHRARCAPVLCGNASSCRAACRLDNAVGGK